MNSLKRIKCEIQDAETNPLPNISTTYLKEDMYKWKASILGPEGSPYEGGLFHLNIVIPNNYPFYPPKIMFETKVYHCNIGIGGDICLDLLKEKWSPALTISKVLLCICSLLDDPNPNDPMVSSIAELYKNNRKEYNRKAKDFTQKYAM